MKPNFIKLLGLTLVMFFSSSIDAGVINPTYNPLLAKTLKWIDSNLEANYIDQNHRLKSNPKDWKCKRTISYLDKNTGKIQSQLEYDLEHGLGCYYGGKIGFTECYFKKMYNMDYVKGEDEYLFGHGTFWELKKGFGPKIGKAMWKAQRICMGEYFPDFEKNKIPLKKIPINLKGVFTWLTQNGNTFHGQLNMQEHQWHFPNGGKSCDVQIFNAKYFKNLKSKQIFENRIFNLGDIKNITRKGKFSLELLCHGKCARVTNHMAISNGDHSWNSGSFNDNIIKIDYPFAKLLKSVLDKGKSMCQSIFGNNSPIEASE